jgi:hypothetical protein
MKSSVKQHQETNRRTLLRFLLATDVIVWLVVTMVISFLLWQYTGSAYILLLFITYEILNICIKWLVKREVAGELLRRAFESLSPLSLARSILGKRRRERKPGILPGTFHVRDDFDEHLPEDFLLRDMYAGDS